MESSPQHRAPGRGARHRQGPGPVCQQHERQQQDGGRAHLARRRCHRRHAHAPEPAPEDAGEGATQRGAQAGKLRRGVRAQAAQGVRADHDHRAREAGGDAGRLEGRQPLVGCEQVRDQHGKQRRGGVQDGREAARDVVLPPDDQRERHDVVEQPHAEEGSPNATRRGQALTEQAQREEQGRRGDRHAQPDQGERRQLAHSHPVEEERSPHSTDMASSIAHSRPPIARAVAPSSALRHRSAFLGLVR